MLPYQEDKKLEDLLEGLFGDNELTSEDIVVLEWPNGLFFLFTCCSYSYGGYSN